MACCGCQPGNAPTQNIPSVETSPALGGTRPEVVIEPFRSVETEAPYLIRQGKRLFVGELEDNVFSLFLKPASARDFFEEPPISGANYTARGWQTGVESFGAVFLGERMVLGQYTVDQASVETTQELITLYENALGSTSVQFVPGKYGTYRFWQRGSVRLMLVTTQGVKGVRSVSVAVGHFRLMDGLRMDATSARLDLTEAARLIDSHGRLADAVPGSDQP